MKTELALSLNEQISAVSKLPGIRQALLSKARIVAERIEMENLRHAQAVSELSEEWDRNVWRHIQSDWSSEEILAAVNNPEI